MSWRVSFTTNACVTDTPYIGKTLRHMLRSLRYPFCERIVALDPGPPAGKYEARDRGGLDALRTILDALLAEDVVDRVVEVPWSPRSRARVLGRYFGRADVEDRDVHGAPVYQYLFAWDLCAGDYVLHADADMLFSPGHGPSWIDEAIAMMRVTPEVVFATPPGGPPQARNRLERLLGVPLRRPRRGRWHRAAFISTRKFLMDRRRFVSHLVPLEQHEPGEPLENSLTRTAHARGFQRWSRNGGDGWTLHPVLHNDDFIRHLDDLIALVEDGEYPFRRGGRPWNIRTDGADFAPWLALLERRRRRPRATPA